MALTGELVGYIDLDASGARRGIAQTDSEMRGLQRDLNGRLRDVNGRFVASSAGMGAALGTGVAGGAGRAVAALGPWHPR